MVLLGSSFCFGLANPCLPVSRIFYPYSLFRGMTTCLLSVIRTIDNTSVLYYLCTDYFTANIAEMLTHARAIGTRPLFPLPFAAWVRG